MKKSEDKKNFIDIANSIGELVQEKNIAYGDSFAKSQQIVSVLYPNGVQPEQYTDMLAIVRVIDKLFRIATKKNAFGESPWRDICGYAILGVANDESETKGKPSKTNAELWEEQQAEAIKESILQSVRDKREEGHGNPYANIDRDVRLSYSNLKDALDNIGDDEDYYIAHATDRGSSSNKQTNTEGHKDNKDNNNPKTLEEWSKVVARRTNNLPEFKRRE